MFLMIALIRPKDPMFSRGNFTDRISTTRPIITTIINEQFKQLCTEAIKIVSVYKLSEYFRIYSRKF